MQQINFGSNEVWDVCNANNVGPDNNGLIWCNAWFGSCTVLYDSKSGAGLVLPRSFVLLSPRLKDASLASLAAVCKRNQSPLGFRVEQARFYQNVYVVGAFDDVELVPLVQAGANVERLTGAVAKICQTLGQRLEND